MHTKVGFQVERSCLTLQNTTYVVNVIPCYLEVWGRHALPGWELRGVDLAPVAPALVRDHDGPHGKLLVLALKHLGNLCEQSKSYDYACV